MDQSFSFGGTVGEEDSYLEYIFCDSNLFRLNAILQDAAGAVRSQSGEGPGYCYMISRWSNSCLFVHVTDVILCFYVKLFLPSTFTSFDIWSGMSRPFFRILIWQIRPLLKNWEFFFDGNVQGYSFCPPKKFTPTMQSLVYKKLARNCVEQWMFGLKWDWKKSP